MHQSLIDQLDRAGHIRSPRVRAAFRAAPRHLFLPDVPLEKVYSDQAIPTKFVAEIAISSSSQPAIMAIMLEQLEAQAGQRVLEIGAGTGYNAALIAHIVGEAGQVITMDIDDDIVQDAREHLRAAGVENVRVICGDGGAGFQEGAPYDRIILTVGAWDIAPAWRDQLQTGGRLLLPLALRGGVQKSIAFEKRDDYLASLSIRGCGFMTLRGAFAATQNTVQLGPEPGLSFTLDNELGVDPATIYRLLTEASKDWNTGIQISPRELFGSFNSWLALSEPAYGKLEAFGETTKRRLVPSLFSDADKYSATHGILGESSFCVLARGQEFAPTDDGDMTSFELLVRQFGADELLAQRLIQRIRAWDAAGRPASERLKIRAYPRDASVALLPGEVALEKKFTKLVIDWN
ncbi:MAG: methyltransferase, FxLD system [Chloroflexi bacterium]|nr:methyltransferase, FxLD system [Chloroflexota bacterium]